MSDDICRNNHGGDPESEAANLVVDKHRWQALALERCRLPDGTTADEAAAYYGVAHNTIAPRLSELKRDGRIRVKLDPDGKPVKRLTRAGCKARVYVTTQ